MPYFSLHHGTGALKLVLPSLIFFWCGIAEIIPFFKGNEVRVKEIPALGAVQTFEYIPFYIISVGELWEIPAASLLI